MTWTVQADKGARKAINNTIVVNHYSFIRRNIDKFIINPQNTEWTEFTENKLREI